MARTARGTDYDVAERMIAPLLLAALAASPGASGSDGVPPRSLITRPLYLEDTPPECRSVRHVHLSYAGAEGAPARVQRTREEAQALARSLVVRLRTGADFVELGERFSDSPSARFGAVLGTFPPGVLRDGLDRFLWSAEIGEISGPIEAANGIHVLQRVERFAGCRQILVRGAGEETRRSAEEIAERARAGEDFAELAMKLSDDPASALRGGAFRIFERGPTDRLLKAATFSARTGEILGPIESPLGYHVLQRVPPDSLDPALYELGLIRARAILVAHSEAPGSLDLAQRTPLEARALAKELHARLAKGEDMAALARVHDDDPTGRERAGDLGWIHRKNPNVHQTVDRLFLVEPGTTLEPVAVSAGWLLLRRER